MYQIPEDKLLYVQRQMDNPNRKISYKITLNDEVLNLNKIMDNLVLTTDTGLDQYGVGCALVTQLQMSLKSDVLIIPKDKITIQIGLNICNEVEEQWETIYTPLGVFYVDTIEEKGMKKSIKAYDGMFKLQKGYFPTAQHTNTLAIANDIATANGYKLKGMTTVSINNEQLEGKTCLEMLSLLASVIGSHVRISRDGSTIEFIEPKNYGEVYDEGNYITPTIDSTTSYNITKLRVNYSDQVTNDEGMVTDEGYYEVGSGAEAQTLAISNPLLKGHKSQAQAILHKIKQLNGYKRFDTTLKLADYRLDPMDIVTYEYKGESYIVPIIYMKMTLSYKGISIETQSPTVAETKSEFSFKGTLSQKVENIYTDIIQVKRLTANKVSTDELEATVATIEQLYVQKAEISELVAGTIVVEDLKAQIAEIDKVIINKADITELNALNATITNLKAQVAEIDDLIANSIISSIIQSGSISSDLLNVKDGFIKDAMILSLSASKINSGIINTNNVSIQSDNGNMLLQGNLLQFKDKNGKVRIQIGQDTTGNYTFTLYDETGNGVLINEKGIVSSNAIADGLIVDSKVSDNANINGSKLDISSVYDEMNADGSKTLKASKVMLDDRGQTLDVSFKEMTTKQDDLEESMSTAITDIGVAQGQISQLIQDTMITTSGGTTKLKDAYNSTKATVDSHTTQIGKMESTIDANSGEIISTKNEVATIKADLDEIELGLSSVKKDLSGNYYTKTQTDSAIKVAKDSIDLSVKSLEEEVTNIEVTMNNIQIGSRNLVQNSAFNSTTGWSVGGGWGINKTEKFRDNNSIYISRSGLTADAWSELRSNAINVKHGEKIVGSWYIKYSSCDMASIVCLWGYKADGSGRVDLTSALSLSGTNANWTRYVLKGTVPANVDYVRLAISHRRNGIIYAAMPQLEYGNTVSDWSPSPVDVNNDITQAKNDAITSSNNTLVTTIANYYTKTQTDSQIKVAKDAIDLSVKSVDEKVSNVTTTINNIQVGGRNLMLKTDIDKFGLGLWVNNGGTGVIEGTYVDGTKTIKVTGNSGIYHDKFIRLKRNTVYTYSMMIKPSAAITVGNSNPLHMWLNTTESAAHLETVIASSGAAPANVWTKAWITFRTPNTQDTYYMRPYLYGIGTATVYITQPQVEEGNKASSWISALEDIQTNIDTAKNDAITSANNTLNTTIKNYYTKTETDSAIKVAKDSITSSVSNTYATKTELSSANTNISNLTNRVQTAESKLTKDSLTTTIGNHYTTSSDVNGIVTSKGYQTSSQVQQTVDALQLKFTQSGGYNLLRNGKASLDTKYWVSNGGGISRATDVVYGTCFKTSLPSGIKYNGGSSGSSSAIRLKNNTHYVYEATIYSRTSLTGTATSPLHFWCSTSPSTSGTGQCTVVDYRQSVSKINTWTKCYVHILTASSGEVWFTPFIYTGGSYTGDLWVTEISLSEGAVETPYSPHSSEIYDGVTTIDKDGVTVKSSNGAYTNFNSVGMNSFNNSGQQTLGIRNGGITFHPYSSNQLGAYITQSALHGDSAAANGLAISTANNGTYIALGISPLSDANTTLNMDQALTISASDSFQPKGINFWKDVHAHGYGIRQLSHLRLAGSGAIQFDYLNTSPSTIYEATSNGHSLYVMGGYQMHLGCMDGKGTPKGVIWMQNSTSTHSYTHWNFHNYTMYNMKTATSYANALSHRSVETYGVSSNVEGIRYLYRDIELIDGKGVRNLPNGYKGCAYDIVSIVCKGRGQAWVESEEDNRFEIQGDCLSVNVEIIIYPVEDVMMMSTVKPTEAPALELPEEVIGEVAPLITNEGCGPYDFWNQYMYSKYLFNWERLLNE